jgi:cytosine/uracil/thiamine/allantoin permease
MTLTLADFLRLIHPILAIAVVFPLLGIVVNRAWLVRSRRLTAAGGERSQIPAQVGVEHRKLGQYLTGAVVGLVLIGFMNPVFKTILKNQTWNNQPVQVIFIVGMFIATIGSLVCLYRAKAALWRAVFATLTGMGLVLIGVQDGVYRRTEEWFVSHYYYGLAAAFLMIFALAILPDIYQDRTQTWRRIHIGLNILALLLFLGQGVTGTRDLLEIPLSWQESHLYQCNFDLQTCPSPPPGK